MKSQNTSGVKSPSGTAPVSRKETNLSASSRAVRSSALVAVMAGVAVTAGGTVSSSSSAYRPWDRCVDEQGASWVRVRGMVTSSCRSGAVTPEA